MIKKTLILLTFVLLVSGALALTLTILDEDFNGGCPPAGWTVVDNAPGTNTAVWGGLENCGEAGNYTNGSDNACCVSTDMAGSGVEVDTELITPAFDLSQCENSVLTFTANYQNLGSTEFFDVDYSADGGATWNNLLSWNEDHGTFRGTPGVDVNLDLSAADGSAHVQIRFYYYDPSDNDWGWYIQIDDVLIECDVPGPPVCTVTVSTPEPPTTSQIAACVHIDMGSHPDPLGSYGAELTWDPLVLDYVSWSGGDAPFLEPTVNTDDVGLGLLTFADADPNGAGGNVYVSCGQFDVIGVADSSATLDLEMTSVYTAGTFIDLMPTAEAFDDSVNVILECTIGDVNDDGSINSGDALIILSHGIGLPIPPDLEERLAAGCGNADGEGGTDAADANVILSFEIGLDVSGNPIDGSNATMDDCADCSGGRGGRSCGSGLKVPGETVRAEVRTNAASRLGASQPFEARIVVDTRSAGLPLGSYTARLEWDPDLLDFIGATGGSTPGFQSPMMNLTQVSEGSLRFTDASPYGATGGIELLRVQFRPRWAVRDPERQLKLSFSSMATTGPGFERLAPVIEGRASEQPAHRGRL